MKPVTWPLYTTARLIYTVMPFLLCQGQCRVDWIDKQKKKICSGIRHSGFFYRKWIVICFCIDLNPLCFKQNKYSSSGPGNTKRSLLDWNHGKCIVLNLWEKYKHRFWTFECHNFEERLRLVSNRTIKATELQNFTLFIYCTIKI